jgi:uncharacterized membrane protein YhfC
MKFLLKLITIVTQAYIATVVIEAALMLIALLIGAIVWNVKDFSAGLGTALFVFLFGQLIAFTILDTYFLDSDEEEKKKAELDDQELLRALRAELEDEQNQDNHP